MKIWLTAQKRSRVFVAFAKAKYLALLQPGVLYLYKDFHFTKFRRSKK